MSAPFRRIHVIHHLVKTELIAPLVPLSTHSSASVSPDGVVTFARFRRLIPANQIHAKMAETASMGLNGINSAAYATMDGQDRIAKCLHLIHARRIPV